MSKYATVVLDYALDKLLEYSVPVEMEKLITTGTRVEVPLKSKTAAGYVLEIKSTSDYPHVKPILAPLSKGALIPKDLFELALWISKYYCTPLHQVLKILIPSSVREKIKRKEQLFVMRAKTVDLLRQYCIDIRNRFPAQAAVLEVMLQVKKGILLTELLEATEGTRSPVDALAKKGYLKLDIVRADRSPLIDEEYFKTKPKKMTEEQQEAFQKIAKSLDAHKFETHLLYGITGSGKTEVYLQAIEKAFALNKGVILLVPEISLTLQTIERYRARFEEKVAVLHHRLSQGERSEAWNHIREGKVKMVIGARSAVFSPVQNLGLIIVDEEHEHSYKQSDEMPCYNARDVAVMRGKFTDSTIVLGSATPSLESYYNGQQNKYLISTLRGRPEEAVLPEVKIVDMQKEYEKAQGFTHFSELLLSAIKKRQTLGEQTILFLNRRGYHTTLLCQTCSEVVRCQHCSVALTFHLSDQALSCHLCGFTLKPLPSCCPSCKSSSTLKFKGYGTEQVEKSLHAVLPEIRTMRIDADTTKHKGSLQKLLRAFGSGKADVLIGTQMIAKGLHFPEVTLVAVLNSDGALNIPDFRASEAAFQLITQVAGRAGRGKRAGEVIIQTGMPENSTIRMAACQDYPSFFSEEVKVRELFGFPPVQQMVKIVFSGPQSKVIETFAEQLRRELANLLPPAFELNPTVPSGHAKVKDRYRFQFVMHGPAIAPMNRAIEKVLKENEKPRGIKVKVDVNPLTTFF